MDKVKTIMALAALAAVSSGCSTLHKALRITQEIEGTGNLTVESPAQLTTVVVEQARQEDGRYHAARLDVTHRGKWLGDKVDLHFEEYSRPLLKGKKTD